MIDVSLNRNSAKCQPRENVTRKNEIKGCNNNNHAEQIKEQKSCVGVDLGDESSMQGQNTPKNLTLFIMCIHSHTYSNLEQNIKLSLLQKNE